MPKLKLQASKPKTQTPNLKTFLETYDAVPLRGALLAFEASTGWDLFKAYCAYVQRGYEVDALDKMAKKDEVQAAAFASGYAKAVEDLSNNFVPTLQQLILGKSQVVEDVRPEE